MPQGIMEADIQSLIMTKLQDLLASCINGQSPEPVKDEILRIATFVCDARRGAGLEGLPAWLENASDPSQTPAEEIRGSYRIRSYTRKQGEKTYAGLDVSPRKRKSRAGKRFETKKRTAAPSQADSADDQPEDPEDAMDDDDLLAHPSSPMQALVSPALALKASVAISSILVDCAILTYGLGQYAHKTTMATIKTRMDKIRSSIEEVSSLDWNKAMDMVKKEHANSAGRDIQTRYMKAIYWDIILKAADRLDSLQLPTPRGPSDNFTRAEKAATAQFMAEAGYGSSKANQRTCRILWKSLHVMRKAGVEKLLMYRTKELDSLCKSWPSDQESTFVDSMLALEKAYRPYIVQLEARATKASGGDLTGRLWLRVPGIATRLEVAETSWNNAKNDWLSSEEKAEFKSVPGMDMAASGDELGGLLHAADGTNRNKAIFVSLRPKDDNFFAVVPIIPIKKGDLLGLFAGQIRYSDSFDATHGIRGPRDRLWLDYARVTGLLNLMHVLPPGGDANVSLEWELYERHGEAEPAWTVTVRALRAIRPFEELERSAAQEQYLLHQDIACAKRGFLKG